MDLDDFEKDMKNKLAKLKKEILKKIVIPEIDIDVLLSAGTIKNSSILLRGRYGTGKDQLVYIYGVAMFGSPEHICKISLHENITEYELFYRYDLAALIGGEEKIILRPFVEKPFKYLNEMSRASPLIQNAILEILSEKEITSIPGMKLKLDNFLLVMDINPLDIASRKLSGALLDRVNISITMKQLGYDQSLGLVDAFISRSFLEPYEAFLNDVPEDERLDFESLKVLWNKIIPRRLSERTRLDYRVEKIVVLLYYSFTCHRLKRNELMDISIRPPCVMEGVCERAERDPCYFLVAPMGFRVLRDLFKYTYAFSWLRNKKRISLDMFLTMFPYVAAHRINVRSDTLARGFYTGSDDWLKRWFVEEYVIRNKLVKRISEFIDFCDEILENFGNGRISSSSIDTLVDLVDKNLSFYPAILYFKTIIWPPLRSMLEKARLREKIETIEKMLEAGGHAEVGWL